MYFFFSSRRRHTRLTCDWSSDVCSSDLRGEEQLAHVLLGRLAPARVVEPEGKLTTQRVGDREISTEESLGLGAAPHRDEIEDLDEEPRPAPAPLADCLDQGLQPGNESVVADSEQGTARDVTDAGGLHDE